MALYGADRLDHLRKLKPHLVAEINGIQEACKTKIAKCKSDQHVKGVFDAAIALPDGTWEIPLSDGTKIIARIKYKNPKPSNIIILHHV